MRTWSNLCFLTLFTLFVVFGRMNCQCPGKCLCFKTTVRCMFLQLEKVPEVPPETTILDLRFNKIKEISHNTFVSLGNLNTLLLNNNNLIKIGHDAFKGLDELRYLYLYKNRIRTINKHAFRGLSKLEQLYVHFNKIEKIEPDTFLHVPALERLFLHHNQLSKVPYDSFKQLKHLKQLRLDSNALICDCEIIWLAEMIKQKKSTTLAAVNCEHPKSLKGRSLASLNKEDLLCRRPKLTEEPNDVDIKFGGTAYFSCKAEGDPKPDIVWLHNNNEISPDEDRYSVLMNGTLMITEAQDLDEGVYECMAKNAEGEAKSRPAKMHYVTRRESEGGLLSFKEKPSDSIVPVGATVVFRCKATGKPHPAVHWTQNNIALPQVFRYHVGRSGTLTITNVQRNDAGVYKCIASNNAFTIASEAKLVVDAPPVFLERPRDQEALEGNNVELICDVEGLPKPLLSWTKDGYAVKTSEKIEFSKENSVLHIYEVKGEDGGIYTCHAENEAGKRNSSALLMVRRNVPPEFSRTPEDQETYIGSSLEIPCHAKGQPNPTIKWTRNGITMHHESDHHRINTHGDLYMFNIKKEDAGIYECVAENDVGSAVVSMTLSVNDAPAFGKPGDGFIYSAVGAARASIDRALNHTLYELFGEPHTRSPGELLQIFRFPTADARASARAAEIYERALEIVWDHVQSGVEFNLTKFSYADILSENKLNILADISGCLIHRQQPSCLDMCFHSKYRSFNGLCNNFNNPRWGASITPFVRLLPALYENGFNIPIGWTKSRLYNGFPLPSARFISTEIVSTDLVTQDTQYTHMLMQWGQFLDHDLDFSMPSISTASFGNTVNCATSCETVAPCFPIEVHPNDSRIRNHRCMEFVRSSSVCGSGLTSVFFNKVQPREQANQLTSFLDASNVYGSNEAVASHLRELSSHRGLLRSGVLMHTGKPLLPFNDGQPIDCKRDIRESSVDCFLAGDVRANEQLGLLSMHTLWMREHNRIAKELYGFNPHWDNDKIYHEARKIVGAVMQHITYSHWLPKILGKKGFARLGHHEGYNPIVDPSISNVFATAALRFGHTLINPELMRLNESFLPIRQGHIPLRKAFFAPFRLLEEGGIDPLMRGLVYASAKLKRPDQLLNSDLTEHLFTPAHLVAQDLAALNIQRGRDHALPAYNAWRKYCNLTVATSFAEYRDKISDETLLRKLQQLYGHPDNVDLWVGGISEDTFEDAKVGPTFLCLLIDQFKRVRDGDRFWYENPGIFTSDQLNQIKQSSLARIICDNGDNITTLTRDVFVAPHLQVPNFVPCNSLPEMKLNVWTECCQEKECPASVNNEINRVNSRPRRSSPQDSEERLTVNHQPTVILSEGFGDIRFNHIQTRLAALENSVDILERGIRRLTSRLQKFQEEMKPLGRSACRDSSGANRLSGEIWQQNQCTRCQCQDAQITCTIQACPPANCANPRVVDNQCCPVC